MKYGEVDYLTKEKILQEHTKSMDEEEHENSDEDKGQACETSPSVDRDRQIFKLIEDKLDKDWYKGTESDDDDLEGIVDYIDLQGYDRFMNMDDEAYEQRRCKLLGIPYDKPPPIQAKTFEITMYAICPDEKSTKIVSRDKKEFLRTPTNVP